MPIPAQATRTAVFQAVYNLLANAYPWSSAQRRLVVPNNIAPGDQPALVVVYIGDAQSQGQAFQAIRKEYRLAAGVYIRADSEEPPYVSDTICEILDAIDIAFEKTNPDGSEKPLGQQQTLGGLVTNCWIDGEVFVDNEALQQQCVVGIPIRAVTGF
jgi:hypothetical protein